MKHSTIKEIYKYIDMHDRTVIENMAKGEIDFCSEDDDYRFIHKDSIDEIQQEELASDEYVLGCFNAWFLADVLEMDTDVIEAMQKSGAYEAIGKLIISMGKLEELQKDCASADGYGHHFSHYDFSEEEINDYYIFRIN